MTIVCGDSHTSTHGAFGALAFGIGTSEVEHVLATQTLVAEALASDLRVVFDGLPGRGVGAKDLILGLIAQETSAGATGYVVEYAGEAIRALSMEGRMTVSNMSIEWGARAGLIAPDDTTFAYLEGRPGVQGRSPSTWSAGRPTLAMPARPSTPRCASTPRRWRRRSRGARTPARPCPSPGACPSRATRASSARSSTWACTAGTPMEDVAIDRVFIGSCTNSRLGDLRAAAEIVRGNRVAAGVQALVVPGSMARQAEPPRQRVSTGSSPPPASSGATPAARCASA